MKPPGQISGMLEVQPWGSWGHWEAREGAASVRSVGTPRERQQEALCRWQRGQALAGQEGWQGDPGWSGLSPHTTQGSSSGWALRFVPLLESRAGPRISPGSPWRKASQPPAHPSPTARCRARACVSRQGDQAPFSLQTMTALDTGRGKRRKKKKKKEDNLQLQIGAPLSQPSPPARQSSAGDSWPRSVPGTCYDTSLSHGEQAAPEGTGCPSLHPEGLLEGLWGQGAGTRQQPAPLPHCLFLTVPLPSALTIVQGGQDLRAQGPERRGNRNHS